MLRTLVQVMDAGTARRATLHSHRTRAPGQWNKESKTGSVGRDAGRHLRGIDIGTGPLRVKGNISGKVTYYAVLYIILTLYCVRLPESSLMQQLLLVG